MVTNEIPDGQSGNGDLLDVDINSTKQTFETICDAMGVKPTSQMLENLVIYDMTDGMRTSTQLDGVSSYYDGGMFALRLINFLKILGAKACYVNVIEEKHRFRENYSDIFQALNRLVGLYRGYARKENVRCRFMGKIDKSLKPGDIDLANFDMHLRKLEDETSGNDAFTALFLINYSLDWAMENLQRFEGIPGANIIVRHTKLQLPTGMLLPPDKSDYSTVVFAQQGSSSLNWSDFQILCLIAASMTAMAKNSGTQYSKVYSDKEKAQLRNRREAECYMSHIDIRHLDRDRDDRGNEGPSLKRVITTSPEGPLIYEF